ncbi:MAG TPA: glycoside hydrolase family 3 N-terminal domain-containing protein [Geodermatophilus sp.]|nr:glycoside hydrolase family 3 N-terminal domain-containing protein [Geodermatophilus sp.]
MGSTRRARRALAAGALAALLLAGCGTASPPGTEAASTSATRTTPPRPGPGAEPAEALQRQVESALGGLDRRGQVAQLFVVGVPLDGLALGDELVRDVGVGGVFLAGRSDAPAEDLAAATREWSELAEGPDPWVAVDQEGGAVQSLRGPGFEPLPSAADQGRLPPDQLHTLADRLGASLATAGVNLNLAPVADVVPAGTEAGNAPIGAWGRHYGTTAAAVTAAAGTVMDGMAAHQVTATLKHFPGLGEVQANTDNTALVVDTTTTADGEQVTAFRNLCASPAEPFVMTSSAVYERIDPAAPAVFSPVVVTDLLRHQLGFDGVVISDDLGAADAVEGVPVGERAVRFLAAGGTLVLTVDPATAPAMIDAVLTRAEADPTFSAQVDAAVRTALTAKARAGLLPNG